MKVLHAAETIKGGVATVLKQIVYSQINQSDIEKVICIVPDLQRSELDCIADENIVTFNRKHRNVRAFVNFLCVFIIQLWKEKPDVVHLHSTFAGVLARIVLLTMWPLRRPKVVYCPHAISFLMAGSSTKRKIYIFIERFLLIITDKVVCVSKFEYDESLKAGLRRDKLILIYNGVPVKSKLHNKAISETINLLFVGRFDLQKGYDIIVNAIRQCNNKNIKLTIVGDSVNEKNIRFELENVFYTGWLAAKDIEQHFLAADALVIPSRWEGFAMVPLEAMSYSLPIIASDATSLPEVVKNGVTGYLFESGSSKFLAEIISNLSKVELARMGKNGNEFFINNFTSQNMIEKTNALYSTFKFSGK